MGQKNREIICKFKQFMKILLKYLLNEKINVKKFKSETFTKHDTRKLKLLIHDTQSSDLNFVQFKEFK